MIPPLRARVIAVLREAGFSDREDSLPVYAAGGTFSAIGGDRTGVNVTAQRWSASEAELGELRAGLQAERRRWHDERRGVVRVCGADRARARENYWAGTGPEACFWCWAEMSGGMAAGEHDCTEQGRWLAFLEICDAGRYHQA